MQELHIGENDAGQRFDKYLKKLLAEAPGSFVYKMLRKKNITLNGKKIMNWSFGFTLFTQTVREITLQNALMNVLVKNFAKNGSTTWESLKLKLQKFLILLQLFLATCLTSLLTSCHVA